MENTLKEQPAKRAAVRATRTPRATTARANATRRPKAGALRTPAHDEIALRAHALYEASGCPHGRDQEFWLEAERQLVAERKA